MNYIDKILKTLGPEFYEPGAVVSIEVLHDDDCPFLHGGDCTCDPEIRAKVLDPETLSKMD